MNPLLRSALVWLALPVRIYLGVVFLAACWHKIADPAAFAQSIATYDILPLGLVNGMAIVLPWVELVVALALMLGFWTRASALAIAGMMIMFMIALAMALAKDLDISCGCFASAEAAEEINSGTMVRDALWLFGALWILAFDDGRLGLDRLLRRKSTPAADNAKP